MKSLREHQAKRFKKQAALKSTMPKFKPLKVEKRTI